MSHDSSRSLSQAPPGSAAAARPRDAAGAHGPDAATGAREQRRSARDRRPRARISLARLAGGLLALGALSPACAAPVSLQHGALTLSAELVVNSAAGLREGVVLLLHGSLAHHRMEIIRTLQALLGERGHNTLAITLSLAASARAGAYPCDRPHRHRHEDALDELDAWLDWLDLRGAGPVVLLGHSRGGNQVAWYALDHPQRVAALVLVAPGTEDPAARAKTFERRRGIPLRDALAKARAHPPDALLDAMPMLHCDSARVSAESFLSYYAPQPRRDTPSLLARIRTPTLVIAGSVDPVVPDLVPRVQPLVGEHLKLVVVDGADHFFRDLYAEDAADAADAFLRAFRRAR